MTKNQSKFSWIKIKNNCRLQSLISNIGHIYVKCRHGGRVTHQIQVPETATLAKRGFLSLRGTIMENKKVNDIGAHARMKKATP